MSPFDWKSTVQVGVLNMCCVFCVLLCGVSLFCLYADVALELYCPLLCCRFLCSLLAQPSFQHCVNPFCCPSLGTVHPSTASNSRPTSLHRAPSLNSELIANALIKKSEFERRKCEITFNDYNLIVLISITACPR